MVIFLAVRLAQTLKVNIYFRPRQIFCGFVLLKKPALQKQVGDENGGHRLGLSLDSKY